MLACLGCLLRGAVARSQILTTTPCATENIVKLVGFDAVYHFMFSGVGVRLKVGDKY